MGLPVSERIPPHPVTGLTPERAPSPNPAPRGPMSEATMDAVARMHVAGATSRMIGGAVGRSPESIRSALEGSLAGKVEEVRGLVIRETATHYFEMMAMLPQVRAVLQGGLVSPGLEERVRISLAQWFHETLVPRPAQRQEHDVHLSGGVDHNVTGLLAQIGTDLAALREENLGVNPLARVRTGPEALLRPVLTSGNGDDNDAA